MDFSVLGPSATFYIAAIVAITQFLKEGLSLRGWALRLAPLLLGVVMALGGLQVQSQVLFPAFPGVLGGVIVGLLLGAISAGGYQTATWLQDRGARVRAQATVNAQVAAGVLIVPPGVSVQVPERAPVPETDRPVAPEEPPSDGEAVELPAEPLPLLSPTPPLPRTMALLPETDLPPVDLRFPPAPFSDEPGAQTPRLI
jgi:hypothetical protein